MRSIRLIRERVSNTTVCIDAYLSRWHIEERYQCRLFLYMFSISAHLAAYLLFSSYLSTRDIEMKKFILLVAERVKTNSNVTIKITDTSALRSLVEEVLEPLRYLESRYAGRINVELVD